MICQLSQKKGFEILQPFTTNEELIRSSVERASGNVWNLRTTIGSIPPSSEELGDLSQGDPEYYKNMMRLEFLHKERRKFVKTIGGILGTFNLLKDLAGRKYVLLVSAGIPDISPSDTLPNIAKAVDPAGRFLGKSASTIAAQNSATQRIDENIKIFDPFNILKKKVFRSSEEVIREIIQFANAQNISVYSLNSDIFVKHIFSGASAEHYQEYELGHYKALEKDRINRSQNLRWISDDTGADSLRGANKFDHFRRVMSTDLNYYYQLSYYPRRKEADNKYHKIKVKVNRGGVDIRFRKGYTDYSKEEANKMQLVTVFYNPDMFKELPFKAEFIAFFTDSGKYEPWMNIALPAKELFIDRFIEYENKLFNLHIWIKDEKSGEKGFGGQINLPMNINSSFMNFIKTIDYLSYHFKGPEIAFKHKEYQAIFALIDPQTNEIGAWESTLSLPDLKKNKEGVLINCVLGDMTSNPKKGRKSFSLSKKDGSLEYGQIKFFPKVTNQFLRRDAASVFFQIYLPQEKIKIQPEFLIKGEDRILHLLPGKLAAESWNKKSKVWSGIFSLDLSTAVLGQSSLHVEIPVSDEGAVLSKEIKITLLH